MYAAISARKHRLPEMAEEILVIVKEPLTRDMIEAGAALIEALDRHKFPFTAAFWLYESERRYWRLMLAVPNFRNVDQRKPYGRLFQIMRNESMDGYEYENVAIIDAKDPLVSALRKSVGKQTGVRHSGYRDGLYIEDSYVYRAAA